MNKKLNRKSASKWDQRGERALIEIWADKMKQLRGCRKNSHILIEMALELEASGYYYTPEEVKTKMHNMTNRYRKEKIKIGSNSGSPSEWDLYTEMETLLAPFKSYHSKGLVADNIKNKKNYNIDRLIKSVERTVDIIKNTSEKLVAIEEEKKEILKKFSEKEAEVQDALLEFLKNN